MHDIQNVVNILFSVFLCGGKKRHLRANAARFRRDGAATSLGCHMPRTPCCDIGNEKMPGAANGTMGWPRGTDNSP